MKNILIPVLALATLASCSRNEGDDISQDGVKVNFSASTIETRTVGDEWEANDSVGIFMFQNLETETAEFANVCYISSANGDFTANVDSESIYIYADDKVDFYAYYPYQSSMTDDAIYSADVSDQSDLGDIDFLTAQVAGVDKNTKSVSFAFEHRLAMLTLEIVPSHIESLDGVKLAISGLNSMAQYSIIDGSEVTAPNTPVDIELVTVQDDADDSGYVTRVTASIMVLPETVSNGAVLSIYLDVDGDDIEDVFTVSLDGLTFEEGVENEVAVAVGYKEAAFTGSSVSPWGEYSGNTDEVYDASEITAIQILPQ